MKTLTEDLARIHESEERRHRERLSMREYREHIRGLLFQVGAVLLALSLTGCSAVGWVVDFGRDVHEEANRPPAVLDPTPTPTPEPTATPEPTPETDVLGAPTDVKAVAGDERVALSWGGVEGAVGYKVIRDYDPDIFRETTATEYVWDGLPNDRPEPRSFIVRAVDAGGNEGPKSERVFATPTAPPPVYRTPTEVRLRMLSPYRAAPNGGMGTGASAIVLAELRDADGVMDVMELEPKHFHQATWRFELAGHAAETRPGPPPRNCRVWWSTDGPGVQVATAIAQYNANRGFGVDILTKDNCCGDNGTLYATVTFTHPGLGLKVSQTYPYVVWDAPPFLDGRRWPPQRK